MLEGNGILQETKTETRESALQVIEITLHQRACKNSKNKTKTCYKSIPCKLHVLYFSSYKWITSYQAMDKLKY